MARTSSSAHRDSARPTIATAVIIAGVTMAVYATSVGGAWVLDDHGSVLENPSIRALWPIDRVLFPPAEAGVGGRPLANLSFALNYAVSGTAAWSYHLGNVLLHLTAALLVFALVRRTLHLASTSLIFTARETHGIGALAALAWAVHPLASGAVDYVAQRTEVLMATCLLATLYAFLRFATSGRRAWAAAAIAACAAGMAAKETMVTAPLLVLLFDRTFLAGGFSAALHQRARFYTGLTATWLFLAALIFAMPTTERGVGFGLGVSSLDYLRAQCIAVPTYLARALWPWPLVFDYGWAYPDSNGPVAAGAALCVGALTVIGVCFRCRPPAAFAVSAAFLLLAPTSSIVPIVQQPIAESRMYLPLAFAIAGLVPLVAVLGQRTWPPALVACGAFAVLTLDRHGDYYSAARLWSDTIAKMPANARAHNELGAALLRKNATQDAIPPLRRALELRPSYSDARVNLGVALLRTQRLEEAIRELETALALEPNSRAARHNLAAAHSDRAVALLAASQTEAALAEAERALHLRPEMPEAHYNRGNALFQLGRTTDATAAFRASLRLEPRFAKAQHNLGVIAFLAGQHDDAIAHFEAALRIDPNYAAAREKLERARARR